MHHEKVGVYARPLCTQYPNHKCTVQGGGVMNHDTAIFGRSLSRVLFPVSGFETLAPLDSSQQAALEASAGSLIYLYLLSLVERLPESENIRLQHHMPGH